MTEQQLLNRVAQRDEKALKQLYDLYYPRLGRFLLRISADRGLVEEVINDVFLVVWQKATSFRGDSSLSTWIMGIAYRKALKAVKRIKPMTALGVASDPLTAHSDDAEDVISAVTKLAPKHVAVIVLAYEYGYSYQEIGQILKCPENTIKTRMFYARKALRTLLEV